MTAYLTLAYDVTNPEEYAKYNPGSMPVLMQTLERHQGKVLSATDSAQWNSGARKMFVLIEFATADGANGWLADPDYAGPKAIREGATANRVEVISSEFVMPG